MLENTAQMCQTPVKENHCLVRVEDVRLLQGRAQFVCNVSAPSALHAVFVRSPHAKARVLSIESHFASDMPGVHAVLSASDLPAIARPQINQLSPIKTDPSPAWGGDVHSVGEPIALVLATTFAKAQAAADALMVDYEMLDANLDFEASNPQLAELRHHLGVLPSKPSTTTVQIHSPRIAASALEPRAALMLWNAAEQVLTAHLSSQTPARAQSEIATCLGLSQHQVRVIATDVGGAFGGKASVSPEDLILALAAKHLAINIRWQASRGEDLQSATHGRGNQLNAQLWATTDGTITAFSAQLHFTLGAWLPYSAVVPMRNAVRILPGPYRVPSLAIDGVGSRSNAAAVGIYRGAGRPEAALLIERAIDAAAIELGLDPLEIRLKNVWQANELPKRLSDIAVQDTANFPALLQRCAELFDYQGKRQAQTPLQGIGIAVYTEPCGAGGESVRLTALGEGKYLLATGSTAQGQGRETAYSQIAAQALGCEPDAITVTHGDTAHNPAGIGALASRSTAIGGSAILEAAKALQVGLAQGASLPYTVEVFHTVKQEAWASGCVMVALKIDVDTGQPNIDELVWVDDAGQVINTTLVHGQLIGGMAQGLGQALLEQIVYDAYGQLLTGSLMDYALPRATDMPRKVHIESLPTKSAANLLGAKGVGEAGCIGVPAAILNAAYDALRHTQNFKNLQLNFPLTSEQLWRAMEQPKAFVLAP